MYGRTKLDPSGSKLHGRRGKKSDTQVERNRKRRRTKRQKEDYRSDKNKRRIVGEIIIMIVWSGVGRPGRRRRRRRREEIDSGLPTSSPTYINSSSVAPEYPPFVVFGSRTGFSEMKHNQVHKKVVFDLVAGACSPCFFARLSRFCE